MMYFISNNHVNDQPKNQNVLYSQLLKFLLIVEMVVNEYEII